MAADNNHFIAGAIIAALLVFGIAQLNSRDHRRKRRRSHGSSSRRNSGSRSISGHLLTGFGAPSSTIGQDGDFYLDRSSGLLYGPKTLGSWPTPIPLTGATGINGNDILYGTGAPAVSLGNPGDFYINTAANLIYGPKTSVWPAGVSLKGAPGGTGAPGPPGGALGSAEFVGFGLQTVAVSTAPALGAFRFDTPVGINTTPGATSLGANGGTVFILQPGTYGLDYEASMTSANGFVLYRGTFAGGPGAITVDTNTESYSSGVGTTWIHGEARLTVGVPTIVAMYPLVDDTTAISPATIPNNIFIVRMNIVQYA